MDAHDRYQCALAGDGNNNELDPRTLSAVSASLYSWAVGSARARWSSAGSTKACRTHCHRYAGRAGSLILSRSWPSTILTRSCWRLTSLKGQMMTDGWRQPSAFSPADFMAEFDTTPLAAIIVTDIDSDIGATRTGRWGSSPVWRQKPATRSWCAAPCIRPMMLCA